MPQSVFELWITFLPNHVCWFDSGTPPIRALPLAASRRMPTHSDQTAGVALVFLQQSLCNLHCGIIRMTAKWSQFVFMDYVWIPLHKFAKYLKWLLVQVSGVHHTPDPNHCLPWRSHAGFFYEITRFHEVASRRKKTHKFFWGHFRMQNEMIKNISQGPNLLKKIFYWGWKSSCY